MSETTARGFGIVHFTDRCGEACSIQQSSAILADTDDAFERPGSSALWLGIDKPWPKQLIQNEGWKNIPLNVPEDRLLVSGRMHLDRPMVEMLVEKLQHWLDTSKL